MVILQQESFFLFNRTKRKFVPCWAILSFALPFGPSLSVYSDGTTKKILLNKIYLAQIAQNIRFGTTSWTLADADGINALINRGTEDHLDNALLISLPTPPTSRDNNAHLQKKKAPSAGNGTSAIWICALTVAQLFQFIQVLSDSLVFLKIDAPPPNSSDSSADALHHYNPRPFQASNAWEIFWNCPPLLAPQEMKVNETMRRGNKVEEAEDGPKQRQKRSKGWIRSGKSKENGKREEEAEKREREREKRKGEEEKGKGEREKRKGEEEKQKVKQKNREKLNTLAKSVELKKVQREQQAEKMSEESEEEEEEEEEEEWMMEQNGNSVKHIGVQTDQMVDNGNSFWPSACHSHFCDEEQTASTQL